jgi:hypothetical protein
VFLIDRMLIGGLRFVLDKVARAVDQEMNDERRLLDELLVAQMRLETGEISEEDYARFEAEILTRVREIKEEREGQAATEGLRVRGAEATVWQDEPE